MSSPAEIADHAGRGELTLRGVVLGVLITVVFTAAQVYLGLKIGLTFATSIPAAVISMAVLRLFRAGTIQENNIVQTIASSAGTLASIIFVLPGLLMIGWWTHIPFWPTFGACMVGGVLGVMYTIPLRRALVTTSDLPYPEGVAAAEVLKVGSGSREGAAEGQAGLAAVLWGAVLSAVYVAAIAAKLLAAEVTGFWRVGAGATGLGGQASLALIGAGYLVGVTVGIAMTVGLILAWGIAVPVLTALYPMPGATLADHAQTIWHDYVRLIGAGAIGAAAIWSFAKLIAPVWGGLMAALEAGRARKRGTEILPREEQDIPIGMVGLITLLSLVPMGWLLASFVGGSIADLTVPLIAAGVLYVVLAGLLAAAVCGYMAGLIGSSNSPVSGIAILSILGIALLVGVIGRGVTGEDGRTALIAFSLFVTTVLIGVAVIANDNLQDLKTGQLVGATPWKQQVGLLIGVVAGSIVIPPILELLNQSNGFAGAPNVGVISKDPLNAPQATLISALAKGVIDGQLNWAMLGIGAVIGVILVLADETLRRGSKGRLALPPLGVAMAIYLPSSVTVPVVIGAVAGWYYDRWAMRGRGGAVAKRLGVLIASGFIVGESLFSVALSGIVVASGNGDPLALPFEVNEAVSMLLSALIAIVFTGGLYVWAKRAGERIEAIDG